ncbi:SIR2 family protein [Pseudoxanthomonas sp. SE1]|uniref:SIR2 family protein n=1 Tax=Pseudoxanthomonas sp. SE1 TaxID=1664560 RepID=UPI00240DD65E|nr:SIR2 family protein [Pseudoxanthomonas sp. SE1]WFC41466.1 SIR2 family protein [Pseudoxanthomonas sp. SE1]
MDREIKLAAVYDKNLSFLIGSGASFGVLPTLALSIKDELDETCTIETLATSFGEDDAKLSALFMHYYKECVLPAMTLSRADIQGDVDKELVLANYKKLLLTIFHVLSMRRSPDRRCNVFTTNYDPCISIVADELIESGVIEFLLNDGTSGFQTRRLQAKNFSTITSQTGIFEREMVSIPQINLVHIHGSVHWRRRDQSILVDYRNKLPGPVLGEGLLERLRPFSTSLMDDELSSDDLVAPEFEEDETEEFMREYKKLPIVNPTKWKFHETVFEEHYYQMLRMLSYELERPNSVLITFGFSFADEHILNLVKRSLSNPKLQVYVCCFDEAEYNRLAPILGMHPNVRFILLPDGKKLTFTAFNESVLSLKQVGAEVAAPEQSLRG